MAAVLVGIGLSATAAATVTSVAISVGLGLVYQALSPPIQIEQEGPQLESARISSSTEGTAMSRIRGHVRIGGQLIWATRFKETVTTNTTSSGGKGSGKKVSTSTTEYLYSASFAFAFCEGDPNLQLLKVWADGKRLDLGDFMYRFYVGDSTQSVDPLIDTIEGAGTVPAFRGVCYLLFEEMPLKDYGNRIPQITAELYHPTLTAP